jgi:hypothetical protein
LPCRGADDALFIIQQRQRQESYLPLRPLT